MSRCRFAVLRRLCFRPLWPLLWKVRRPSRPKLLPFLSWLRRALPCPYSVVPLVLISSSAAHAFEQVLARGFRCLLVAVLHKISKNLRRARPLGLRLRELTISSVGFSYSEVDCQSFSDAARESFLSQDSSSGSRRQPMCQPELGLASLMRCAERS